MNAPQTHAPQTNDDALEAPRLHLDRHGRPVDGAADADLVLDAEADLDALASQVAEAAVVEIHFETLKDGRGYSHARSLREDLGFKGELRATGDVGVDQLHYLLRAGFSTFVLRSGVSEEAARAALERFSHFYVGVQVRPRVAFLD